MIQECQRLGKITIYAFLSHTLASTTSALSVLHSFIFQLTRSNNDLETALCHSSRQVLKSNLDCAAGVLKLLLGYAGPTCLIVDGLDEMETRERQRLLSELITMSKACDKMKVLICSRPESDIERVLGAYPRLRVDRNNTNSIEVFVSHETSLWLSQRDHLIPEEQAEIEHLLVPVAERASGKSTPLIFGPQICSLGS